MESRRLGHLWPVSVLSLGGGGVGSVWGVTTRDEAVATVREAAENGVTLFDLAPTYGEGEAEAVVGEAFGGDLPQGVRVTTKHHLGAPPASEVYSRLRASLEGSLARMRLARVDLFFLHGMIVPDRWTAGTPGTPRSLFVDTVVPAFERLIAEGLADAWGITGIGVPSVLLETLADGPPPAAVQCIANPLDSPGGLRHYDEDPRPRELIAAAHAGGAGVMGIRPAQAGALTDRIDRVLAEDHLERLDFARAQPFREIARGLGVRPAYLAHRYALSMAGVDTVVLGVKSRAELRECLQAEADGRLEDDVIAHVDRAVGRV